MRPAAASLEAIAGPRSARRIVLVMLLGLAARWAVRAVQPSRWCRPGRKGHAPEENAEAHRESGETEPHHQIAALILLRHVPLVLGHFVLELLPVLTLLVVAHSGCGRTGRNQPPRHPCGSGRLRAVRRHPVGCPRDVLAAAAASAPAGTTRSNRRLRHALDPAHRCDCPVSATRRGRPAACACPRRIPEGGKSRGPCRPRSVRAGARPVSRLLRAPRGCDRPDRRRAQLGGWR